MPPAGSCYKPYYFAPIEALRPLVGTQTRVRLYGDMYCCSVEGPGMEVHHYEIETTTAVRSRSWGKLKQIYR
jgi:hypothetical protein